MSDPPKSPVVRKSMNISFQMTPRRHSSPPATEHINIPMGMHEYEEEEQSDGSESEGEDINPHNLRRKTESVSIPRLEFEELVADIVAEESEGKVRLTPAAIKILQSEAENMIVKMFEKANEVAGEAGREKVKVEDIETVLDFEDE